MPRDIDSLDNATLLREGIAAARAGSGDAARTYLAEATRREPENADAWLWLASVEAKPQVKRDHFERVLRLRPGDLEATAGLEHLVQKYGEGVLQREGEAAALRCTWHPDRETGLRCARCGRPICPECARQHPVGMRCKECAKELRSPIYKVSPLQYVGGFVVGLICGFVAGLLSLILGRFWFLMIFAAVPAGTVIGDAVGWGAGRKRGRGLQITAGASVVIGTLIAIAVIVSPLRASIPLVALLPSGTLISPIIFLVLGTGAAVRRLR